MAQDSKFKLEITGYIIERSLDGKPVIAIDAMLRTPDYGVPLAIRDERRSRNPEAVSAQIADMLASLCGLAANGMLDRPAQAQTANRLR